MNRTVIKLAWDHLLRDRKAGMREALILFLTALLYFTYMLSWTHISDLYQTYCENVYGSWYACADIPDEMQNLYRYYIDFEAETMKEEAVNEADILKYGYLYIQGEYQGYQIGCAEENIAELCRLELISGTVNSNHEILISDQLQQEKGYQIGDSLNLTVGGITDVYKVSGIIHKSQDLFPDIYTDQKQGHMQVFFDRSFGFRTDSQKLYISSLDLPLSYTENPYGYDHYTVNNDWYRWKAEQMSFGRDTLITLVFTGMIILLVFSLSWSSMRRRTRELELLQRTGMTIGQMTAMALSQALILSGFAGICGMFAAFVLSGGIDCYFQYAMGVYSYNSLIYWLLHPAKPLVLLVFFLALTVCGAFVPVLRASQAASGSPFVSDPFLHHRKHRIRKKYLSASVMAYREIRPERGFLIRTALFLAVFCVLVQPQNQDETIRTAFYKNSVEQVSFNSRHFVTVRIETALNPALYSDTGVKDVKTCRVRQVQDGFQLKNSSGSFTCMPISVLCLDDTVRENIRVEGRIPDQADEILICSACREVGVRTEDASSQWISQSLQIGDTVFFADQKLTVVGIIVPSETYAMGDDANSAVDGSDTERYLSLYAVPECTFAVAETVFGRMDGTPVLYQMLSVDNREHGLKVLDEMTARGFEPAGITGISDFTVRHTDADLQLRGINIVLPVKALRIPASLILWILYLLNQNRMMSGVKEDILLRTLGMTPKFRMRKQLWKAAFLTAVTSVLMAVWQIFLFRQGGKQASALAMILIFCLMIPAYSVMTFVLPLKSMKQRKFENLTEE